jgi:hypothetical protein
MLPYAHASLDFPDDDPRWGSSGWRFSPHTRRGQTEILVLWPAMSWSSGPDCSD